MLLFDEADSLLFDRSSARASWEVSQVNELLTWLDHHPLPVVAATNHVGKLDPAAMRRFVFKLELRALSPAKAAKAFERFFAMRAPASLASLEGLTPGDLAVVARQLRHSPTSDAAEIVARLQAEVAAKPAFRSGSAFDMIGNSSAPVSLVTTDPARIDALAIDEIAAARMPSLVMPDATFASSPKDYDCIVGYVR